MSIRVEPLTGAELTGALNDLGRLRIQIFREWPYLYDGSMAYESRYLRDFGSADGALIVAAFDGDEIIGAATASPITGHLGEFAAPWRAAGWDTSKLFYFGESVLRRPYRGQGIGHAFFDAREAHARSFGRYTHATFCAVARPDNHPLRNPGYRPLDPFWRKRGFEPVTEFTGSLAWKDLDKADEDVKPMRYWVKAL